MKLPKEQREQKEQRNPFLDAVQVLSIWKYFPTGEAVGVLAASLADWCDNKPERARWLVSQVDTFNEYPGPMTLRKMIKDHFEPAGPLAALDMQASVTPAVRAMLPEEVRKQLGTDSGSALVLCAPCGDTGILLGDDGKYRWCDCADGVKLREASPNLLEFWNMAQPTAHGEEKAKARARSVEERLKQMEGVPWEE